MSEVLTTSEAARALDVAEVTVRKLADTGRLRVRRTSGGLRVFMRDDVERFIAERVAGLRRGAGRRPEPEAMV